VEIEPQHANAHYALGIALQKGGKVDEAVESYRRALELDPAMAPAQVNLGIALGGRDVEGALAAFERAAHLFAQQGGDFGREWESFSQTQIQALRRSPALEDVLAGRRPAASPEEWADAVRVGFPQSRYAEIVALTEHSLPVSLEASDDAWRTDIPACAAALLAADTAAELSAAERARLRGLAHAWLEREVTRWKAWMDDGGERAAEGRRGLEQALREPDLASLRGDGLVDLPEPERAAWQELWASTARALEEDGK
jgi:tetratricopeptide (TPR) repeat protein